MSVALRTCCAAIFAASTSLTGCQVCHPALKKACSEECAPEIHVKAPPQKIVIHRDDCPPPSVPCEDKPAPVESKGQPTPAEAKGQPTPAQAQGQPGRQQMMMAPQGMAPNMAAPMAASGFAAIPTLPTGTALTLTFDIIRIPIPIPRLRTVDVPPESRLSWVQVPAQGVGAAQVMAAPIQQAAYVQGASEQVECIRPDQLAAAIALLKAQQANAGGASAAGAGALNAEARMESVEKSVQGMDRMLDEMIKKELERKKAAGQSKANSADGWGPSKDGK